MTEVAAAFIEPACAFVRCLWGPIAKRINYVRKLPQNLEVLRKKASELRTRRDDIVVEIERLKLQKVPTKACDAWRNDVGEMENKVRTIEREISVEKKCIGGSCPDIFARVKLGEQVVKMISDISSLIDTSKFENGFHVDSPPAIVEKKPDPENLVASAYNTMGVVLEKIRDERTTKIGIWGMGGVGKTTVLHLLNNSLDGTTLFDFVILVTVTKSPSIRKLQSRIAKRLKIEITSGESDDVASTLFRSLEGKKYLLLLDDVWDKVDLSDVGFPNANQKNGCKIVLTTRTKEVCRKMGTNHEIYIKGLLDEEAREIFDSEVGHVASLPNIRPYAHDIVGECAGLPLALKVVSSALREEENESIWRNFLRELRSPATSYNKDLLENVLMILKVSYDRLKEPEKKQCLLMGGWFPEDCEIEKSIFIELLRAEGILPRELTLAQAQDKGDAILQALIDVSLLEKSGTKDDCVRMHDLVRDLVVTMTSTKGEEPQHLVRGGISSEKIPDVEEWKKATRISFTDQDLCNLPESPDCPELLTLFLGGRETQEMIPETFFNNMPNLRVLLLSRIGFKSRSGNEELNALSQVGAHNTYELRHCGIGKDVTLEKVIDKNGLEMGAFPNLEFLYLGSLGKLKSIFCLEMEEGPLQPSLPNTNSFTNLKKLFLYNCPLIEQVFSCGFMVQQLSNLEELVIKECEELKGMMIPNDQKIEYETLPKLRKLQLISLEEFDDCFKGVPMCWQSLEHLSITDCPKLRKLPFGTNSTPKLKVIDGKQEWWDALEWDNDAIKLKFQPFLFIKIEE